MIHFGSGGLDEQVHDDNLVLEGPLRTHDGHCPQRGFYGEVMLQEQWLSIALEEVGSIIQESNIAAQDGVGNVTYRLRSQRSGRRRLKAGAACLSDRETGANSILEERSKRRRGYVSLPHTRRGKATHIETGSLDILQRDMKFTLPRGLLGSPCIRTWTVISQAA